MEDFFANSMREREKFLTTGCAKLDKILKGGIPCRGITQIYGMAGTGKTQLALQLSLTVQLPVSAGGFATGAVYVCTEACFPSRRLQELIQKLDVARKNGINGDCIYVEHAATMDKLEHCLLHRIPVLMSIKKIGLIVIDSIAAPYRVEDWNDKFSNRAESLRKVALQLHKLSRNNYVGILCINQVSAVLNTNDQLCENREDQPTLGTTWSSIVTTSIRFFKRNGQKYACIMASSHLPRITIPFQVKSCGIVVID